MAKKAELIKTTTPRTVYDTTEEIRLTLTVHEAQLIRELAGNVASEEGDSLMDVSDALRDLVLPETYAVMADSMTGNPRAPGSTTIYVVGRRNKGLGS